MYFGEGNSNFLSSYREPSELVILHSVEVLNDKAGDQVDTRHAGWTLSTGPFECSSMYDVTI